MDGALDFGSPLPHVDLLHCDFSACCARMDMMDFARLGTAPGAIGHEMATGENPISIDDSVRWWT